MEIFLAILILAALAIAATSTPAYRLRRSRVAMAMLAGGWPAVAVGVLLGEGGLAVIDPDLLRQTTPLIIVGLGWIGMMIGLQLRLSILKQLPKPIARLATADAAASLIIFGAASAIAIAFITADAEPPPSNAAIFAAAALLAAGSIGWSMETRSQRLTGTTPAGDRLAFAMRTTAALAAAIAITGFGLALVLTTRTAGETQLSFDPFHVITTTALALGLAIFTAVLGNIALGLAGKDRGHQLAIVLGITALSSGVATQVGLSPLLSAMLTGAALTNIAADRVQRFQNFILRAEHTVAILFALLAGLLASADIRWWMIALAAGIATARLLTKPAIARQGLKLADKPKPDTAATTLDLPKRSSLYNTAARQSPVAIAMAVSIVVIEWSTFQRQLLTVVLLAGVIAELLPIAVSFAERSTSKREPSAPTQTAAEPTPDGAAP